MISERECINLIQSFTHSQDDENLVMGIGDDCAVLKKDETNYQLLTTDTLVSGVHFDLNWHPPHLLGRKSAAVNLSDIAAMGGDPRVCLLSVAFPDEIPSWLEEFMSGFSSVLKEHDTRLVGGDTVKGNHDIVITVMLLGEVYEKHICYRAGALPGDLIWVSGSLGMGAAGLELCRKGMYNPNEAGGKWQQLAKAHLDPEPLIGLGKVLAASRLVNAMMDISDGLATDLAHLCNASGVGAEIQQNLLPVSEQLEKAAQELGTNAFDWMLKGGEDYQLLFTTKPSDEKTLRQIVADYSGREISPIGRIIDGEGVYLCDNEERQEISYQGYDHFAD